MTSACQLEKWRALLEPEICGGLTPMRWDQALRQESIVFEADRSVVVTRDIELDGKKVRSIWAAAGELGEVLELLDRVDRSAEQDGIRRVVFIGRRGWVRAAKGFHEACIVGVKEL